MRAAGGRAVLTDPALPSGSDRVHAALAELDPEGRHDVVVNLQGDFPTHPAGHCALVVTPLADPGVRYRHPGRADRDGRGGEPASFVKAACAFDRGRRRSRRRCISPASRSRGAMGPRWHHVGIYATAGRRWPVIVSLPPGSAGTARATGTTAGAGGRDANRLRAHGARPVRGRYAGGPGTGAPRLLAPKADAHDRHDRIPGRARAPIPTSPAAPPTRA